MLRILKGDQENLAGRAVVYSSVDNKEGYRIFPSLFIGHDPDSLFLIMRSQGISVPPEVREGIERGYAQIKDVDEITKEAIRNLEKNLSGYLESFQTMGSLLANAFAESLAPLTRGPLPIDGCYTLVSGFRDDQLDRINGDVIRTPNVSDLKLLLSSVVGASNIYLSTYRSQQNRRRDSLKTYTQFERRDFIDYVIGLTQRIFRAIETRENFKNLLGDLKHVSKDSPIVADVDKFCSAAKEGRTEIMVLHMDKAIAVLAEDFEKAAILRDKIDETEKSKTTTSA